MTREFGMVLAACGVIALSGCGGNSSDDAVNTAPVGGGGGTAATASIVRSSGSNPFAVNNRSLESVVDAGGTSFAPTTASAQVTGASGFVPIGSLSSEASIQSVTPTASGGVNVVYRARGVDRTVSFAASDFDPSDQTFNRDIGSDSFTIGLASDPNTTFVGAIFAGQAQGRDSIFITAAPAGLKTRAANVPTGSARYTGNATAVVTGRTGTSAPNIAALDGSMTLNVGFDTREVNGRVRNITGFLASTGGATSVAGELGLNGSVNGGEISGRVFELNAPRSSAISGMSGEFAGDIFGPNGEEVGAAFSASGDNANAVGVLIGAR